VPEDFLEFDAVEEVNANDNRLTFGKSVSMASCYYIVL